jgi:L-2-hydroxyglutarate oxidase LhgO
MQVDVAVVGGGIVGLAVAWTLQRTRPGTSVVVLEKEDRLTSHQSGRSSGVLHTGVYYEPGSLKARTCHAGRAAMVRFCETHGVPWRRCGKVIVATTEAEVARLDVLTARAAANGVRAERVGPERLAEIEPHARGLSALYVPDAGVVDYRAVGAALADGIDGEIRLSSPVVGFVREARVRLETPGDDPVARVVVNCAGLHNDRVAAMAGVRADTRIVPFRGEYWALRPEVADRCRGLIYPVPDPALPFLGVHLTRGVDDVVTLGPNAVLAFAREGYHRTDVSLPDLWSTLTWPGFWRLLARHGQAAAGELVRSVSRRAFASEARKLVPAIDDDDLRAYPAGVRAQALDRAGTLVHDFVLREEPGFVHVLNAPSPAATASLEIARTVVGAVTRQLAG